MKIKLLVLAAAISPAITTLGQTSYLYNKGKMAISGTSSDSTVLYINGDFVSDNTEGTAQITLNSPSRTVLTGNFKHNGLATNADATVFTVDATTAAGAVFEFRGTTAQTITTDGQEYANIPDKKNSYITFPTLQINNPLTVTLDPALGIKTIDLALTKGTLVLDADSITDDNKKRYFSDNLDANAGLTGDNLNPDERSVLAHLWVTGNAQYNDAALAADRGFVEVKVPFDPSGSYNDKTFGSVVGMGIPFKGLGADYFTFNYLFYPTNSSIFGPNNGPLDDANAQLIPGKGYIIGNELKGDQYADYQAQDNKYGTPLGPDKFAARFAGEYIFNRIKFAERQNSNNIFGSYSNTNTAYTQEKINDTDVTITLEAGYNYLANPYTTPLDISDLFNTDVKSSDWGVTPGIDTPADIYNAVWVLNGSSKGSAKYNMYPKQFPNPGESWSQLELNYYLATKSGATYINSDNSSRTLIPPLQMFVIYAYKAVNITIPKSKQVMGENTFIRSASTSEIYDDFVFEVQDLQTKTSDRASVVLRSNAEMIANSSYLNIDKLNLVSTTYMKTTNSGNELDQAISSQLFTKNETTGAPLTIKFLSYSPNVDKSVSTPLYLKPSLVDQDVVIRGYRLDNFKNFDYAVLVDNLLGKEVIMTPETEYKTTIKSTDQEDRFTLIFLRGTNGIEDEIEETSNNITSYYANGILTVTGFDNVDFGSTLTVYDMQGRQVAQTKVNDYTVNVTENFAPGAFIVKVVGNSSYVAKFLVR